MAAGTGCAGALAGFLRETRREAVTTLFKLTAKSVKIALSGGPTRDRVLCMSVDTPSEELRVRAWEEMIAANRRAMYCARLAARKRRIQRTAGALAAALSAAACAVILSGAEVDQWLLVLAVPAAVLSGVCGFGKHGDSATRLVNCSVAWADLHHCLQDTWSDIESGHIDAEGVREALAQVREHARTSSPVGTTSAKWIHWTRCRSGLRRQRGGC